MVGRQLNTEQLLSQVPEELPILPLRNVAALPFVVLPLSVGIPRSVRLIEDALQGNRLIGLAALKDAEVESPVPGQIYETGTVALILKVVQSDDGTLQVLVQNLERIKIDVWTQVEPYLKARTHLAPDVQEEGVEAAALQRGLLQTAKEVAALIPNVPQGIDAFLEQIPDARQLLYLIASNSRMELPELQALLEIDQLNDKLRAMIAHLNQEREILSLGQKISEEVRETMSRDQREFYLRRQMEAIRKELGESDEQGEEVARYRERIAEAGLAEEAQREALRELGRLEKLSPQSAEYGVIKTYLDWLVELPWQKVSQDNLAIANARDVLNADHYGLEKIKERILEHLAVRKLVAERQAAGEELDEELVSQAASTILCFVGPPGVGKTSLGRSIARALGRSFTRMSLGGMRDEAEIRGHRRTYVGALPGRIIQSLKRAGTRNPVFILDEVDKIGSDWRGDPSSALLEVLDPQQNHAFRDHYLDVDFDLSDVIFICTANELDPIPAPLRDRMEIIQLEGYTEYEKLRIAEDYLVPRQRSANGLRGGELSFDPSALRQVIRDYTREAGVRNLEREIGRLARKAAVTIAEERAASIAVTPAVVREYLGKPRFRFEAALRTEVAGVATGLAWTPAGGDVLFVEATRMPGSGHLTITGQLGKVMEESVRLAFSYARSRAVDLALLASSDFHIHVPEGAIPKDGPSAGITMVTALVSLLTGRPVHADVGMTGEMTLRGQVLPIGGLKQKVLAAHRAGLKTVILPEGNADDLDDLPADVRAEMRFVPAERLDDVLRVALQQPALLERPLVETVEPALLAA
jgi:ATP-dependent Lon protease